MIQFENMYKRKFGLEKIINHGLDLPEDTYIMYSPALEKILFDRSLVGWDLQKSMYRVSRSLFEILKDVKFSFYQPGENFIIRYPEGSRFEQVNLAGSDYYQLQSAHATVFNSSLPRNYIALRRKLKEYSNKDNIQEFETEVFYKRFEAKGKLCILGETIATGISAVDSLKLHLPYAKEHGLDTLILFSIAGSKVGAEQIYQIIKKFNINVVFIFGLALFELGEDGTALLWDGAITLDEYKERGKSIFLKGECCIGDWGGRFSDKEKYLDDLQKELQMFS